MNLTGHRIVRLPSCLRNTSSANDISANSIEPYAARISMSRSDLISSGVGARPRRWVSRLMVCSGYSMELRLVACYGRIVVRSPPCPVWQVGEGGSPALMQSR